MSALRRLWSRRRDRPRFVAAAAVLLAVLVSYPFVDWWLQSQGIAPPFRFWDFGAYGGAVERWQAGEPLYEANENGGFHGTFLYPPVAVFLFLPFMEAPVPGAALAWVVTSVLLLWVGLQLLARSLGLRLALFERALLLAALLGYQPLLIGAKLGQTAPFMAAMLCFAFVALRRGEAGSDGDTRARDGRVATAAALASGAFTAVVGVVKLAYASVGAHLLADRRRFAGAVLAGLALLAVSVAVFGVETHRTYVDVLGWGVSQGSQARVPRPYLWLPPYYRPLGFLPEWSLFLRVAGSIGVAALALLARDADREVFALGVAAFPLLTPLAYTYYLTALLPAAAIAVAVEFDVDGRPELPVVALLLLQFHSYGLLAIGTFVLDPVEALQRVDALYWLVQPGLWGAALLAGLLAVRVVQVGGVRDRLDAAR